MKKLPVAVIVGTRPEAIKMAPVIQQLASSRVLTPVTISTSQHRHMVDQVFASFGIRADHQLFVMRDSQTLSALSGRLATRLGELMNRHPFAAVLVQGDTSSAFFGGLSAFYHQVPVGHIEAGLRTGNRYAPFPEEMNRRLLGAVATWHFAPTQDARRRLLDECIPRADIFLTGNTVVDALHWIVPRCSDAPLKRIIGRQRMGLPLILVTCHRRESLGKPLRDIAAGLARLARRNPNIVILLPLHPNPAVRRQIRPRLAPLSNVVLSEPLNYEQFLCCLKQASFIISDSGGVQEEAAALGKPVLVLREETERQEGVRAGALKLVGSDPAKIVHEAERLLKSRAAREKMSRSSNLFGDGHAAERIVRILERSLLRQRAAGPSRR